MTADHLGSARVITNQYGAVTTRKDYMAFGEEASSAQRTANPNYDASETRKGYTGYEKDSESGLEFAQARYYNATHGRFTSVDPLTASATIRNPQTFNRYSYTLNSPYKFTDPLGLISSSTGAYGSAGDCPASHSGCYDAGNSSGFADPVETHEGRHANEANKFFLILQQNDKELEEKIKNLKKQYPEFSGEKLKILMSAIALARSGMIQNGKITEFYEALIREFRNKGDNTNAIDILDKLKLSGGVDVITTPQGKFPKLNQNVFDGEKSEATINDPLTNTPIMVYLFFRKYPNIPAVGDGKGNFFIGPRFFSSSMSDEDRAITVIHEFVIHKAFGRLDAPFGNGNVEKGSHRINEIIRKYWKNPKK